MGRNWVTDLKSCLLFLTILPVGRNIPHSPRKMIRYFPLAGLMIGTLVALMDLAMSQVWPDPVTALMDVIGLAVISGALHLDGLGDTADGILSHRSRERALEIMKDSRIGMMGLVTVVSVMAMKWGGIYAAKQIFGTGQLFLMFMVVPAYSRAAMILGVWHLDYGRKDTGIGRDLFIMPLARRDVYGCLAPLILSIFLGYHGVLVNLLFGIGVTAILWGYKKTLGCITGDMLGAMTELMEAVLFLGCGAAVV